MNEELIAAIKRGLLEKGLSAAAASKMAIGKKDAIALILRGHDPSFSRVQKIACALDLELYIGPSREVKNLNKKVNNSGKTFSWEMLEKINQISEGASRCEKEIFSLQETAKKLLKSYKTENSYSLARVSDDNVTTLLPYPSARPVPAIEYEAAAGGGRINLDDAPQKGLVYFKRDWLDEHGIDPTQCAVIRVTGESMEPTLFKGCSILIDRSRVRLKIGYIYVILTETGLIVKRLGKQKNIWRLVSDNPAWEQINLPRNADIIGQVMWTARSLV